MPSHTVVVMGPSGSGKSTIGMLLAEHLGCDLIDADDLHPAANVEKMSNGIPLDDADRQPWLELVANAIATERELKRSVVVACSALTRRYRDILRVGDAELAFVYLDGTRELLAARLGRREGHFMPSALLDSQLDALEPLGPDERGATVSIDASPQSIVESAVAQLQRIA